MTTEEFNALPLEARRFIEANAGCLSCGSKENKLTKAYELYLKNVNMDSYRVRGGGVNYKNGNETGVLYNVKTEDTPDEIRHKIKMAQAIYKKAPHLFVSFDEKAQAEILKGLPKATVVDISKEKAPAAKAEEKKVEEAPAETEDKKEPEGDDL